MLSRRQFPSTCFIRRRDQLDYLEEPDIFHDVFGHVPLLVNPVFADFMEAFGQKGLEAIQHGMLKECAALYWFTVEFGLISTCKGLRIYGAGITSSIGESIYAVDSDQPARLKFNLRRMINTLYPTNTFQKTYFVIESFQDLFNALQALHWEAIADECRMAEKIPHETVLQNDQIF